MSLVVGHANAKIGSEEFYRPTIGLFNKHEEPTDNENLLIDYAKETGVEVLSTYFERNKYIKEPRMGDM